MKGEPKYREDRNDEPSQRSVSSCEPRAGNEATRDQPKKMQVTFRGRAFSQLVQICNELGIKAPEFVREACNLLVWAHAEANLGKRIGSIDPGSGEFSEVLLPTLFDRRKE